jgi:excisionase family DNA binding protein
MRHCVPVRQSDNDLLTSTQAGQILGKSSRTVLRLAEAGALPIATKLPGPNGHFLFKRSDIEALAAKAAS